MVFDAVDPGASLQKYFSIYEFPVLELCGHQVRRTLAGLQLGWGRGRPVIDTQVTSSIQPVSLHLVEAVVRLPQVFSALNLLQIATSPGVEVNSGESGNCFVRRAEYFLNKFVGMAPHHLRLNPTRGNLTAGLDLVCCVDL